MSIVYTVTTEFADQADAIALRDIIRELGFSAELSYRTLDNGPTTPARDTRLGKLVLRIMTPVAGASAKSFTIDEVAALIEEHDYAATSAAAILAVLTQQGDVVRVMRGLYRLHQ